MLLAQLTTSFQTSPGNANDHSAIQLIVGVIAPVMMNVCGSRYIIAVIIRNGASIAGKEVSCAVFR